MKLLRLGDLHIGVKQDDPWVQNIQRHAIKLAIDYSLKNGIKTWIQLGDWFDVRKAITHASMEFNREIVGYISAAGIHVHVLVGNHDMHTKSSIHPNACTELLAQYDCITVYDKPTTVDFDGCLIDLMPWMCEENTSAILNHIKTSDAEFCAGHWELNGFYFYKGMKSHGLEPDFLKKYKQVWSGHFHTISSAANVSYDGTPYTLTAGDENDTRGVWEFDTKTKKSKFIQNPITWHKKVMYPVQGLDPNDFKNLAVRVIVEKIDDDLAAFENALELVVHELRVVNRVDNSVESEDGAEVEVKSVKDLIGEYIEALPECSEEDKTAIKQMANQLWIEATS